MSKQIIKNGKIPASVKAKVSESAGNFADLTVSAMAIDSDLEKELSGLNLAHRFINIKKFRDLGFNKSGWAPYKRKQDANASSSVGMFSQVDSEGYVKRGDLVLATRPKGLDAQYKSAHKRKNALQANTSKNKAEELRNMFREAGISSKEMSVQEGYEDKDGGTESDE